jgi:hypothetical protein
MGADVSANTSTRFRVGPFVVDVAALPEAWRAYAPTQYHAHDDATVPELHVRLRDVAAGADQPTPISVQSQEITRDGDTYVITSPGAFTAFYDPRAHTLVMDVSAHMQHPHLVLGNALRGAVSLALPLVFDGLMFHASSGIFDGHGLLFPGISTAGKTTLALGLEKGTYMSDDVSLTGGLSTLPRLDASPFFGAFGKKGANESAPLAAVGVLVAKAERETSVTRVSTRDAVPLLMRHAIAWTKDARVHGALLARVVEMTARVPVFAVERFIEDSSDAVCERVLAAVTAG